MKTKDFKTWTDVSNEMSFPKGNRHGTILKISQNILDGIKVVNPSAVDINSGVESTPGIKDGGKVENIFSKLENTKGHGELF